MKGCPLGPFAEHLESPGIVVPIQLDVPQQLTIAGIISRNHDPAVNICLHISCDSRSSLNFRQAKCRPLQAQKTCYYNDTYAGKVHAIPCDGTTGIPDTKAQWRTVVQLDGKAEGAPDGLAIDCHGKLWVAHERGGQVLKLTLTGSNRSAPLSGVDWWNTCIIPSTSLTVRLAVYMINIFSHCHMQQRRPALLPTSLYRLSWPCGL